MVKTDLNDIYQMFFPYVKKEGWILDLGCRSSRDSLFLELQSDQVVAVDDVKELVTYASA
ncbi:Uncharacterised protein [Turicibacter sanguinis]|nr:Uncharacterised protein [Turicibacter sanguinis]